MLIKEAAILDSEVTVPDFRGRFGKLIKSDFRSCTCHMTSAFSRTGHKKREEKKRSEPKQLKQRPLLAVFQFRHSKEAVRR